MIWERIRDVSIDSKVKCVFCWCLWAMKKKELHNLHYRVMSMQMIYFFF